MTSTSLFQRFAELHVPGDPFVLFNVWDAGSAQAVAKSGAKAIATGSVSVANANGFGDGEQLPLDLAIANAQRVVEAVDLPVTIDFEAGYAAGGEELARNTQRLAATGAIGCNFEDQIVGTEELYPASADALGRLGDAREFAAARAIGLRGQTRYQRRRAAFRSGHGKKPDRGHRR